MSVDAERYSSLAHPFCSVTFRSGWRVHRSLVVCWCPYSPFSFRWCASHHGLHWQSVAHLPLERELKGLEIGHSVSESAIEVGVLVGVSMRSSKALAASHAARFSEYLYTCAPISSFP